MCLTTTHHLNLMGSLPTHRVSPSQLLEHTRTLCVALAEQKVQGIQSILREKKFTKDLVFVLKHLAIVLGMTLVSEIACLRVVSVLLFLLLVVLTFYVLFDALQRCKEIEGRLTQELTEMALLTENDSDHED